MKTFLINSIFLLATLTAFSQVFADFEISSDNEGTGTLNNALLPDFTWVAVGTINGTVEIKNNEIFNDGNTFENLFGQADDAENLRIQVYPNGYGTVGDTILSTARLSILFDETTPLEGWGFCIVDIDVENCLISAINEHDEKVSYAEIDSWLVELFDADTVEEGMNVPKWDSTHAAILGFNTPDEYTVYNTLVLEGMQDSEAPSAFFMPNIPLKELIIDYENLQSSAYTSFHFFIASLVSTGISTSNLAQLSVFPNPATSELKVQSPEFKVQNATVAVFTITGKKCLSKHVPAGSTEVKVDISSLNSGIYFCKIQFGDKSVTKKIVVGR